MVSTEYNPQIWTVPGIDKWYPINNYSRGNTLVFAGWSYLQVGEGGSITYSEPMLPGDVMSAKQIESATIDGSIHVYANWEKLESYSTISREWDWRIRDYRYVVNTTGSVNNGNIYTNILYNTHSLSADNTNSVLSKVGGPVTVRGGTIALGSGTLTLQNDTIMDSMELTGSFSTGSTHGDGNCGLYAGGHTLVIGEGVETGEGTASSGYPQLFGGANGGTVHGTKMIVHTGTYGNVVSGSRGGTVSGDTYIVLRDVHVLDTLIGSSSGTGVVTGSAYVYATSLDMHGDYYEEKTLESSYTGAGQSGGVVLTESTILTGGSNNGSVGESTHVHISGDSVLWDVQGAGRRGQSVVVGTAHVDISGMAWVKHVVCGSITDGLDGSSGGVSGSNECVKNTSIVVGDSAKVGSVFGAGYDTFYKATYSSMYNGGSIEVTLEDGCTVGYVYG
ncbi:MAG: hypothetical protein IKA33_04140, partial [Candidatus Methanomethylophilaceae archaeon]|nr:hypothetical protein [Candidatus Methanomethylophilaceae archaeon]